LLEATAAGVGLLGARKAAALQGMGGVGKTVLAAAAVSDERITRAFPDDIYWLTLGQTPDLQNAQRRLLRWIAPDAPLPTSIQEGRDALDTALKSRRCLLVLDHVRGGGAGVPRRSGRSRGARPAGRGRVRGPGMRPAAARTCHGRRDPGAGFV
jgi:hypothetical protein